MLDAIDIDFGPLDAKKLDVSKAANIISLIFSFGSNMSFIILDVFKSKNNIFIVMIIIKIIEIIISKTSNPLNKFIIYGVVNEFKRRNKNIDSSILVYFSLCKVITRFTIY